MRISKKDANKVVKTIVMAFKESGSYADLKRRYKNLQELLDNLTRQRSGTTICIEDALCVIWPNIKCLYTKEYTYALYLKYLLNSDLCTAYGDRRKMLDIIYYEFIFFRGILPPVLSLVDTEKVKNTYNLYCDILNKHNMINTYPAIKKHLKDIKNNYKF